MRIVPALLVLVAASCHNTTPVTIPSLSSGSTPSPSPIAPRLADRDVIRVMSYNVNFGLAGDPAAAAAVAEAHPDVVFLQETTDEFATLFATVFPGTHQRFDASDSWPAGGMGIVSRFPIVSIDKLAAVAGGGPFFAWRVILDVEGTRVQVMNVHLRPPMSDDGSWIVGYWSTRESREHEIAWHAEGLDKTLPTLVVGDFNEEVDGLAVGFLRDRGFTDAIDQFAAGRRTWEWPVGSLTLRFQLDHVLYDEHVQAIAGGIVEAGRSDHKPVWADIALRDAI